MTLSNALPHASRVDLSLKRGMDVIVSFGVLTVLSPVFLLLACAVILSSPGGAFFRQQRVGRNGKLFWLYKFRSMRPAPEMQTGSLVTASGDARITSVGRLLRHTKLDELPQFWNVLKGDMSLVGPRPEVPRYVAHYTPEQRAVLLVRPGITGAAQLEFRDEEARLAGCSDVETFYITHILPEKLAIDLRYVRERSLWGDVRLLFRTVGTLLK
jgi:lipopolysaccharide/colanic/teichoic acid biosynthesis glycosyltransferase